MTINIHDPKQPETPPELSLFNLGFRPFFLMAGIFAVLSMVLWMLIYQGVIDYSAGQITLFQWHAHEMIFGYAMAVIAGFLLTAVQNWTGQKMPAGRKLALMVLFWVGARVAFVVGGSALQVGALFNLCFMVLLAISISDKIVRVRQWRQAGIVAVIALLAVGELTFIIGLVERDQLLISRAIYGAFYLIMVLILLMARRVVPFFIERGVGYPVTFRQSKLLDIAVVGGFLCYAIVTVLNVDYRISAALALLLFVCQSARLFNWYTAGIWKKPLLWSLYLSLVFIDLGFLLAALAPWLKISSYLIVHAFAVGGIGFITLSMMSRVALGHTGRDIHSAPGLVTLSVVLLALCVLSRVALPMIFPSSYVLWIGVSQLLWIVAFVIFSWIYGPMFFKPRVDGRAG